MKMLIKILILISFLFWLTSCTYSQTTATGRISAEIIEPIMIQKISDMDFGAIETSNNNGIVELSALGDRSSNLTLSSKRIVSNATFKIIGRAKYSYSITIKGNCLLNKTNNSNTNSSNTNSSNNSNITNNNIINTSNSPFVDSFTSFPSGSGVIYSDGSSVLKIGAKLHLNANQEIGVYNNANGLVVVVNYD